MPLKNELDNYKLSNEKLDNKYEELLENQTETRYKYKDIKEK